jgi:hypothetical protein
MYLLEGGPRGGELVDEVPASYLVPDPPSPVELFEGFVAYRAEWAEIDETHFWPWLADHSASARDD